MANVVVWCVWVVAAFACVSSALAVVSFRNPFFSALALIGNLGSLAVLYLLLGGEFVAAGPGPRSPRARGGVRRGGPGARLRRCRDGDVPVRDRLPGRPNARGALGRRAVVAGDRRG